MSAADAFGFFLVIAIPIGIIRALIWFDGRYGRPQSTAPQPPPVERSIGSPEQVVHHVHHIDWAEAPERISPVEWESLTPAARRLIEEGHR